MSKDGKKLAIGLGVAAATIAGILLLTKKAEAAPPPLPGLASLSGIVTDTVTGQPIQGVSVILDTLNTSTNSSGGYSFNNVEPGYYQITFSKSGYNTLTF